MGDLPLYRLGYLFRVMRHIHHVWPTLPAELTRTHIYNRHTEVGRFPDAGARVPDQHAGLGEEA